MYVKINALKEVYEMKLEKMLKIKRRYLILKGIK